MSESNKQCNEENKINMNLNLNCNEEEYTILYAGSKYKITALPTDKISSIKYKIIQAVNNERRIGNIVNNIHHLYLTCQKCTKLYNESIYHQLEEACSSFPGKGITDFNIDSFRKNIGLMEPMENNKNLQSSSLNFLVMYDKIVHMELDGSYKLITIPLGVKFNSYVPSTPPLNGINFPGLESEDEDKPIIHYGNIYRNIISVHEYDDKNQINSIYYPKYGNEAPAPTITNNRSPTQTGSVDNKLLNFNFEVPSLYPMYIDLPNILNSMQATESLPIIKHNIGKDNVVIKAFCKFYDNHNEKIPYTPHGEIINKSRISGTQPGELMFYLSPTSPSSKMFKNLVYTITKDGTQKFHGTLPDGIESDSLNVGLEYVNNHFKKECDHVHQRIVNYLNSIGQTGLEPLHDINIYDDNVSVGININNFNVKPTTGIVEFLCKKGDDNQISAVPEPATTQEQSIPEVRVSSESEEAKEEEEDEEEEEGIFDIYSGGGAGDAKLIISRIKVIKQVGKIGAGSVLTLKGVFTHNDDPLSITVDESCLRDGKILVDTDVLYGPVQSGSDYREITVAVDTQKVKSIRNVKQNNEKQKSTTYTSMLMLKEGDKYEAEVEFVISNKNDAYQDMRENIRAIEDKIIKNTARQCPQFGKKSYCTTYGKNIFETTKTREVVCVSEGSFITVRKDKNDKYSYFSVDAANTSLATLAGVEKGKVLDAENTMYMFFVGYGDTKSSAKEPIFLYAGLQKKLRGEKKEPGVNFCGVGGPKKVTDIASSDKQSNNYGRSTLDMETLGDIRMPDKANEFIDSLTNSGESFTLKGNSDTTKYKVTRKKAGPLNDNISLSNVKLRNKSGGLNDGRYTDIPIVSVTGTGRNAKADVSVQDGLINFDVKDAGEGYTEGDEVKIDATPLRGNGDDVTFVLRTQDIKDESEDSLRRSQLYSFYNCVNSLHTSPNGNQLIDDMLRYLNKDKYNFLNLQNGDLYTVFSRNNKYPILVDGNGIALAKKEYIKYLKSPEMSYEYAWDLTQNVLGKKLVIIQIDKEKPNEEPTMICPSILDMSKYEEDNKKETVDAYVLLKLYSSSELTESAQYFEIRKSETKNKNQGKESFQLVKTKLRKLLSKCLPYKVTNIKGDGGTDKTYRMLMLNELIQRINKKNKYEVLNFYLSPLSHKVIGVLISIKNSKSSGKKEIDDQLFIPCYPSSIPLQRSVNCVYEIPHIVQYNKLKETLENLDLKISCHVMSRKNDKTLIGVIIEESNLFIPCVNDTSNFDLSNQDEMKICELNYEESLNPYQFDSNLSKSFDSDIERVKVNNNLLQESRMYSNYRVKMKSAINNVINLTNRRSILEKVLSYKNKLNEDNNNEIINNEYKTKMKEIKDILLSLYDNNVDTEDILNDKTQKISTDALGIFSSSDKNEQEGGTENFPTSNSSDYYDDHASEMSTLTSSIEKSADDLNNINGNVNLSRMLSSSNISDKVKITKYNLLSSGTGKVSLLNKHLYTMKLADEIMRYNRIRDFILGPSSSIPSQEVPIVLSDYEKIYNSKKLYEDASKLTPSVEVAIKNKYNTNFNTVIKV